MRIIKQDDPARLLNRRGEAGPVEGQEGSRVPNLDINIVLGECFRCGDRFTNQMPNGHDRDIASFAFDLALRQRDGVLPFRDRTVNSGVKCNIFQR